VFAPTPLGLLSESGGYASLKGHPRLSVSVESFDLFSDEAPDLTCSAFNLAWLPQMC
jgi:hypothetical protein